ncbi:unnamed protein product [Victoria cruziana]
MVGQVISAHKQSSRSISMEVLACEAAESCAILELPTSSFTVDIAHPLPQIKPQIAKLCKELFKKWSSLDDSCLEVETVSGGITNLLLKVSVTESIGEVSLFMVRVYGPNTEYVIDRNRELQAISCLSAAGFGPTLLGVFGNGMVQSYINALTLSQSDMRKPKLAAEIARKLRSFHQVEVPGSKEPQLWNDIFKFFDKASSLKFDQSDKQMRYDKISFGNIKDEINELKVLLHRLDAPVVFAHNDLLAGNVMHNEDEDKLYFIDFEYGSYSYRGYDIANHFNEYAGFDCDYSLYPDKDSQYHFFRHYLLPEEPDRVSDEDLEALYVETNCFSLASHIYWALWALIQVILHFLVSGSRAFPWLKATISCS